MPQPLKFCVLKRFVILWLKHLYKKMFQCMVNCIEAKANTGWLDAGLIISMHLGKVKK